MSDPVTAPDLESIIAAAIASHVEEIDYIGGTGWCVCNERFATAEEHAAHQARAVLAAISEAGAVEWGVFRKDSATEKLSEYVWASAEDATHWAAGEFTPDFAAITEARSRVTFPWERAE